MSLTLNDSQRFRKQEHVSANPPPQRIHKQEQVSASPPPYTPTPTIDSYPTVGGTGGFAIQRDPVPPAGADPK